MRRKKIYISSADYMSRNTIRRVEVAIPVEDEKLKKRLWDMFTVLMSDNVKARTMMSDGTYLHVVRKEGEEAVNSQEVFYNEACRRLENKQNRQNKTVQKKVTKKRTGKNVKKAENS